MTMDFATGSKRRRMRLNSILEYANASIVEDGEGYKLVVKFTDGRAPHVSEHKTFKEAFAKMERVAKKSNGKKI